MNKADIIGRIKKYLNQFTKKDILICFCAVILVAIILIKFYSGANTVSASATVASPAPKAVSSHTEIETRIQNTLSDIKGVGRVSALVTYSEDGASAIGAVIIAEGASLPETRVAIEQAVRTALGIEAKQIKIYEMGNN